MKHLLTALFLIFNIRFYSAVFNKINNSYWFRILRTPSCWIRNSGYKYNEGWDKLVNTLIDYSEIVNYHYDFWIDMSDGTKIWIANYPYCFGYPHTEEYHTKKDKQLTSRKTAFKLYDMFMEYLKDEHKKG